MARAEVAAKTRGAAVQDGQVNVAVEIRQRSDPLHAIVVDDGRLVH